MRVRRVVTVLAGLSGLMATASPASAATPGPRPTLVIGELSGPTTGPDGERQWTLAIDAVDRDGAIWEVVTKWSDGEISFANTFCLQGPDPGTPAHLLIPHTFAAPGRYRVQVQATSVSTCAFEPDRTEQHSRRYTKILTVSG